MNEIILVVAEAPEGGFTARTFSEAIFTEADGLPALRERVRDAVHCHFDEGNRRQRRRRPGSSTVSRKGQPSPLLVQVNGDAHVRTVVSTSRGIPFRVKFKIRPVARRIS